MALLELYNPGGGQQLPADGVPAGELLRRFSAERLVSLALHVDYRDDIGWLQARNRQPARAGILLRMPVVSMPGCV